MGKFCHISTELLPVINVENWLQCPILSFIWSIFFTLCMGVDIKKKCFAKITTKLRSMI